MGRRKVEESEDNSDLRQSLWIEGVSAGCFKVDDIVKRILNSRGCNNCDVYVACEGKALRRNEELRSCGVSDGCTVQVVNRIEENTETRRTKLR